MALELALLKTVVELVASDAVVRGAKAAWGKLPWARDAKKVEAAERRTAALAEDVASLARTLPTAEVESGMDRVLGRFEKDLTGDGLRPEEARTVRDSVRAQLRASVLGPVLEIRRLGERLDVAAEARETAERTAADLMRRVESLERRANAAFIAAAVAALLAALSIGVVAAGALVRR